MRAFYSDTFVLPLPSEHRFPVGKYRRLRQAVQAAGVIEAADLHVAPPASDEDLLRVHTLGYLERVKNGALEERELRRIGFPWSPALVERSRRSVGGTIAACRAAVAEGVAVNLAGGTHHAFADRGEGFCVFNDVAVAARAVQAVAGIERVTVIDCDVHQGNGTASIFADDPSVFTLSIHGRGNYPFVKERSDLDLELADGAGDVDYLAALVAALGRILLQRPDLVLYVAGADPYRKDRYGRLALSRRGLAERDRQVLGRCADRGVPVATVMGGGYAAVEEVVAIHLETVRTASAAQLEVGPRAATSRSIV
jgi:acetoin utilization deacetylase AcuC-like enzyme